MPLGRPEASEDRAYLFMDFMDFMDRMCALLPDDDGRHLIRHHRV
jgi:hypothetical protein